MTPEAKQAIVELLAQIARQNEAERIEKGLFAGRATVRIFTDGGGELAVGVDEVMSPRWRFDCLSCAGDPAYARILDLWSQVVSAAKALEGGE